MSKQQQRALAGLIRAKECIDNRGSSADVWNILDEEIHFARTGKRGTIEEQLRDGQPLRGRVCKAIGYRLTKRTTDEQIVEAVERFAARKAKGAH